MVEDLGVVGTLDKGVKPHADRLVPVSFLDVEVGQGITQGARLGAKLQQGLAQLNTFVKPLDKNVCQHGTSHLRFEIR